MTQIVLDAEAFKALSSDTRLQILKALDARRLTVSELGRLLNLNKATVFEHLKQLAIADLVKKEDEGRKWVYYRLTWKGRNVLHPENVQFMLLLATSALSVGGLVAQLGTMFSWWSAGREDPAAQSPETTGEHQALRVADSAASDTAHAPEGAGQTGGPGAAKTETGFADGTPPAVDPATRPNTATPEWWQNTDWWLVLVLGLLVVAAAWFVFEYARAKRRARREVARRLDALGPDPEPA